MPTLARRLERVERVDAHVVQHVHLDRASSSAQAARMVVYGLMRSRSIGGHPIVVGIARSSDLVGLRVGATKTGRSDVRPLRARRSRHFERFNENGDGPAERELDVAFSERGSAATSSECRPHESRGSLVRRMAKRRRGGDRVCGVNFGVGRIRRWQRWSVGEPSSFRPSRRRDSRLRRC